MGPRPPRPSFPSKWGSVIHMVCEKSRRQRIWIPAFAEMPEVVAGDSLP